MPQTKKIATCCYCGTRAVLVLDKDRHELSCSACGAPLHDMKLMPVPVQKQTAPAGPAPRTRAYQHRPEPKQAYKKRKKRKRKPIGRKIFEEIWDVVEDIFD